MKKDNSKLLAILLVIITIIVVIVSFILNNREKEVKFDGEILDNPSQFFTVNSCLYRTINYISDNDTESLIKLLSNKYRKKYKINKNNILEIFPKAEENSTFVSKKMYYQEINKHITRYYVYGEIRTNVIHDYTIVEDNNLKDVYFIVDLDSNRQLFSIEPYDGKIFLDGEKNG